MRKLATIRIVKEILPIDGADKIELAKIDGWQCVVGKGQFKVEDKGLYFEIDSALPIDDSRYEILIKNCRKCWRLGDKIIKETLRIKTIKLKGQLSQGLLMPLNLYPEIQNPLLDTDYSEILRVEHFDEVKEKYDAITGVAKLSGNAKGNFPSFIPKTDEESIQNLTNYFKENKEIEYEITEKADGSSMTVYYSPKNKHEDPLGVCSRNIDLKDEEGNVFWRVAQQYNLLDTLPYLGREIAIQGELVGPGINGNREQLTAHEYRVFRIWDIEKQCFVSPAERYNICNELNLPHVRMISYPNKIFTQITSMDMMLEFVKGKTASGTEREGLVFKAVDGSHSFKCINNEYLLKEK